MSVRVPEIIDPLYLAEKQRFFEGEIALATLPRLKDRIIDSEAMVTFALDFSKIAKLAVIKGVIRAKIQMQCQCCLQALDVAVNCDVNLAIVQSDEQAALIPDNYEPLLCGQEKIAFADIIEDEILLALPVIAKHPYRCVEQQSEVTIEPKGQAAKDSPFSVLANLKKTGA